MNEKNYEECLDEIALQVTGQHWSKISANVMDEVTSKLCLELIPKAAALMFRDQYLSKEYISNIYHEGIRVGKWMATEKNRPIMKTGRPYG